MECPFCAEHFNDTALVCKSCKRDLRLVLPVIEENLALIRQAGELQLHVSRLRAAEERSAAPFRFWATHAGIYLIAPMLLLLAVHYLVTVRFNVPLIYLRLGTLAVPLPFGFALLWLSHHGFRWSLVYGATVGVVSVTGMLTIIAYTDHVPILPENFREWREAAEYAASIMLAYATGNVLGALAQRIVPRTLDASGAPSPAIIKLARALGGHASEQALRRRAQKISDNLGTIGTALGVLGTAGASLFAGLRAFFGDGS
jgi:hypothetical protein